MESCERTEFEQKLARAAGRAELEGLSAELAARPEAWAKTLRLMIGWKLASFRQRESPNSAAIVPPASFVELLRSYGLPTPDGRPLFQYQLGNDEFQRLEAEVHQRAAAGALGAKLAPGLFVVWAADWFRRRHPGGMRRWLDIENALGCDVEQSKWREYTDRGLKLWGRRALFINGTRHRLLTLAREGGFPVAALEGDAGWASRLLTNTVSGLLGLIEPDEEIAFKLARSNAGYAPSTWQDEDFFSLCADLALAIVELRRQADAPAAAAGLPVSVWLDANWTDWRASLPITTDNEAGKKLVDGLMRAEPIKLRAGDVQAARILRKEDGAWISLLRLNLTGLISGDAVKGLDRYYGRLRAFASGELARYINGELALLEPPEEGEDGWLVRPLHRGKREAAVPLHVPAELELRADGRPIKRICPSSEHLAQLAS